MVQRGEFRLDLYHRIAGITLHLPSLRERREDLPGLVRFMVERISEELGIPVKFRQDVVAVLRSYEFPGNVRELYNILKSTVVAGGTGELTGELLLKIHPEVGTKGRGVLKVVHTDLVEEVLSGRMTMAEARRSLEYTLIQEALTRTDGNITKAAQLLGMKRPRLSQMVKELGLKQQAGGGVK